MSQSAPPVRLPETGPGTRPVPAPAHPVVHAWLAVICAGALTAALVASAAVVSTHQDELSAGIGAMRDPEAAGWLNSLNALGAVASVGALLATTWWLQGIRAVAAWANPSYHQRRSGVWVPFGWLVPVVSWWFPYQVVADASRAVGSRVVTFWPWWISWLLLAHTQLLFGQRRSFSDLGASSDLPSWVSGYQWGAVVALVSFVLWCRIVRATTVAARDAVGIAS